MRVSMELKIIDCQKEQFLMASNPDTVKDMVLKVLFEKEDWSKHLAHTCTKCEKCNCGKHKCKFTPLKMNLQPTNSTYHQSYQKPKQIDNKNERIKAPVDTYHPNQLVAKSQYREEYIRKKNKSGVQPKGKAKPNNLQLGGPTFNTTTYDECFTPKHSPPPKKIKNPENLGNSGMRMNTVSNYQDTFKWNNRKQPRCEEPMKRSNNIKVVQQPFVATSNYNHDFNVVVKSKFRDNDNFAPVRTYNSVQGVRPKSSYQTEYIQKRPDICPATYCS